MKAMQVQGVAVLFGLLAMFSAGCAKDSGGSSPDPMEKAMKLPPSQKLTAEQKADLLTFLNKADVLIVGFDLIPTKQKPNGKTVVGADRIALADKIKATCKISPRVETDDHPDSPDNVRSGDTFHRSRTASLSGGACVTPIQSDEKTTTHVDSIDQQSRMMNATMTEKSSWSVMVNEPTLLKDLGFSILGFTANSVWNIRNANGSGSLEWRVDGVGAFQTTSGSSYDIRMTHVSRNSCKEVKDQEGRTYMDCSLEPTSAKDLFITYKNVEYVFSARTTPDQTAESKSKTVIYINGETDPTFSIYGLDLMARILYPGLNN